MTHRISVCSVILAIVSGTTFAAPQVLFDRSQIPDLRQRVMRYAWLDHAPLPWQIKAVWAHHRYVVGVKG